MNDAVVAEALIAERKRLGHDRHDEVHAGRYIVNAAPNFRHNRLVAQTVIWLDQHCGDDEYVGDTVNVGPSDDFRITDACVRAESAGDALWALDGACRVAVDVLSPDEAPDAKLSHYASHGVGVYIEVDPGAATVRAVELAGWHVEPDVIESQLAAHLGFD